MNVIFKLEDRVHLYCLKGGIMQTKEKNNRFGEEEKKDPSSQGICRNT